jgi:hypothetical protein
MTFVLEIVLGWRFAELRIADIVVQQNGFVNRVAALRIIKLCSGLTNQVNLGKETNVFIK